MDRLAPMLLLVTGDPVQAAREERGSFADMIRARSAGAWHGPWVELDARSDASLPEPSGLSGIVITGSASSVTERAPWMLRTEEYLRRAVDARLPILGICFGHQLLGAALGGRVERNPRGREIGSVEVSVVEQHPWLPFIRGRANATHVDSVVELPSGAARLASTSLEPNAAVSFADRVVGVQFHPEIDGLVMRRYVEARRGVIAAEGLDAGAILDGIDEGADGATVLERFFSGAAGARDL